MYPEPQLYLYPTNLSIQKSCDFFPRDPAQKSCSEHMKNVQTIIPDHAKILQMLMRNTWKTMQIPWNLLLLNGCGWSYIILKYVTLMHTHWNSRQTPPANPNVLRATTTYTFSTSQLLKVVRACGVLYIFTWKCASRHDGVHFFDIATSKSAPTLMESLQANLRGRVAKFECKLARGSWKLGSNFVRGACKLASKVAVLQAQAIICRQAGPTLHANLPGEVESLQANFRWKLGQKTKAGKVELMVVFLN